MPRHSQQMNLGTAPGIYEHHFKKKIVEFCDILQEMNRAIIANNALPDKEMCVAAKFFHFTNLTVALASSH